MRALSIRQPFAELILRGIKTVEYRSWATRIVGERFLIYASKGGRWKDEVRRIKDEGDGRKIVGDNIVVPTEKPPKWMLELAELLILDKLPTGVIVGSAVIEKVTRGDEFYQWHLADIERAALLRKPKGHPQPSWFKPF